MLDEKLFYNDAMPLVDDIKLLLKNIDLNNEYKKTIGIILENLKIIDDNAKIFALKEIENFTKAIKELLICIYNNIITPNTEILEILFSSIDLIEIFCYKYIFKYKIEDLHESILEDIQFNLKTLLSSIPLEKRQFDDKLLEEFFKQGDKTILFVDDSIMIRKICERVANTKGYKVLIANEGLHGLRLAMKYPFDLIFSDVNMPKVNGFEMVAEIRKLARHRFTPIVMLTTERDPEMMNYAKSMGVKAWLTKPFTKEKLFETFEKLIAPK